MARLFLFIFVLLTPLAAKAQPQVPTLSGQAGEILNSPVCNFLHNRSDQVMMGTIYLKEQTAPSGDSIRQSENFRLEPDQKRQICALGPFYEGRRIELVIRTLIPLFTCRTTLDREIFLDATPQDNGMKKLSATCY